jgi:hypothetical protein
MVLALSGSEVIFDTRPWSSAVNSDNCYDYAIGDFERTRTVKSTPGNRAGFSSVGQTFKTCGDLQKRILADNPGKVYSVKATTPCRKGFYKIMNFVAKQGDFHFYKQIRGVDWMCKEGDTRASIAKFLRVPVTNVPAIKIGKKIKVPVNLWAHKQGWGAPPIITDAKGKTIVDPRKASRKYPGLDYNKLCGCYCVKKGARSGNYSKSRRSLGL